MIKYLGLILMADAMGSLLNKRQVHKVGYDLIRVARLLIGFYLFLFGDRPPLMLV